MIGTLCHKVQDIEALQVPLAENRTHLLVLLAQIEAKSVGMESAKNARRELPKLQLGE